MTEHHSDARDESSAEAGPTEEQRTGDQLFSGTSQPGGLMTGLGNETGAPTAAGGAQAGGAPPVGAIGGSGTGAGGLGTGPAGTGGTRVTGSGAGRSAPIPDIKAEDVGRGDPDQTEPATPGIEPGPPPER